MLNKKQEKYLREDDDRVVHQVGRWWPAGADRVAWGRGIDHHDVAREVARQRRENPDKKCVVAAGVHGIANQKHRHYALGGLNNTFVPEAGFRQETFYHEDKRLEQLHTKGMVSVYDVGKPDRAAAFKRQLKNGQNVAVFGMCHGDDNKRF